MSSTFVTRSFDGAMLDAHGLTTTFETAHGIIAAFVSRLATIVNFARFSDWRPDDAREDCDGWGFAGLNNMDDCWLLCGGMAYFLAIHFISFYCCLSNQFVFFRFFSFLFLSVLIKFILELLNLFLFNLIFEFSYLFVLNLLWTRLWLNFSNTRIFGFCI